MNIAVPLLPIFISVIYIILPKLIAGKNKIRISETTGKHIQRWGLVIIGIACICFILLLDNSDNNLMRWFWLSFVIVVLGFQSFLEWLFLKHSKQYIISLLVLILSLIYIIIFIF